MTEIENQARVSFELSREALPALLEHLGSFALKHNLSFKIENPASEIDSIRPPKELPVFNPSLVRMLPVGEFGELEPVVTKDLLDQYAASKGAGKFGARLISQLATQARNVGVDDVLARGNAIRSSILGIRVSRIDELRTLLKNEAVDIRNVGKKSVELLDEYCDELFSKNSDQ